MSYVLAAVVVSGLFAAALSVIAATLHQHADAIVAALAGKSLRAEASFVPAPRVRVTVRQLAVRRPVVQPLRAAA